MGQRIVRALCRVRSSPSDNGYARPIEGVIPVIDLNKKAHNRNKTPHIAVTMSSLFVFLVPASMSLFGLKILDIYGYLGTIGTY